MTFTRDFAARALFPMKSSFGSTETRQIN